MLTQLLWLSLGIVTAQGVPNCKDRANLTQVDLNACALESAKLADARLNQVYRQLRAKHKDTPAVDNALITAQLAWIKFRDQNCEFARTRFERGSIAPLIYYNCLERTTQQRTTELEGYLKGIGSRDGF